MIKCEELEKANKLIRELGKPLGCVKELRDKLWVERDELRARLREKNEELVRRSEAETRELTDVLTENAKLRREIRRLRARTRELRATNDWKTDALEASDQRIYRLEVERQKKKK